MELILVITILVTLWKSTCNVFFRMITSPWLGNQLMTSVADLSSILLRLVFLDLAIPWARRCFNQYKNEKNTKLTRYNRQTLLPNSCRPNVAYFSPDRLGGEQGLLPIPRGAVERILKERYNDHEDLFRVFPPLLARHVLEALQRLQIQHDDVEMSNLWRVLRRVVRILQSVHSHVYRNLQIDNLNEEDTPSNSEMSE